MQYFIGKKGYVYINKTKYIYIVMCDFKYDNNECNVINGWNEKISN